jgi:hypothetical protein
MHEYPNDRNEIWYLQNKMWRWLKWQDGANVLLADKSEAGWYTIPDRGVDPNTNTTHGEANPEHVHHDWVNRRDLYERDGHDLADQG